MKLIESSGKGLLTPSKAYYPHLQPYISPVGELIEQAPQQTPFHSEALTTNNTIIFEYSSTYTIIIILAWRNEPTPYISPKRPRKRVAYCPKNTSSLVFLFFERRAQCAEFPASLTAENPHRRKRNIALLFGKSGSYLDKVSKG